MEKEKMTPEQVKKIARENTENMSIEELNKIKEKLKSTENVIKEKGFIDGLNFSKQIAEQNHVNKNLENQARIYIEAFNAGLKHGIDLLSNDQENVDTPKTI